MSFYIFILAFLTYCGTTNNAPTTLVAEETPESIETNTSQQNMLIGEFKKEDLQEGPYASWFNSGYENFKPSQEAMETIKKNISEYEIVAFMGTWCPDSRREIPHFYKILDEAGYDLSKLTMIGVDKSKSTPDKIEKEYNVERVPTFIFMKDGKEVNRFVEYAQETLDKDIAKIVSEKGEEYKNSYSK